MIINRVTVIGANGRIGYQVAALIASNTSAKVFLISRSIDKSKEAIENAILSVENETIRTQLIPKTYDDLSTCLVDSQWIYESVSENEQVKFSIHQEIAKARVAGTIVSTGTSGLSISKLAKIYNSEGQSLFFGTHFFNPIKLLPLLEFTKSKTSNNNVANQFIEYLSEELNRKVITTKDKPAFLANRIGFTFLNEIAQFAEIYKDRGGIDYIDTILGPETGRRMSPINTIDYVGLDVHTAIVENLRTNDPLFFSSELIIPSYIHSLVDMNLLGRKTGGGLYKVVADEHGNKQKYIYDIKNQTYRPYKVYTIDYLSLMKDLLHKGLYQVAFDSLVRNDSEEADICLYFLIKYLIISFTSNNAVGTNLLDMDVAMSYGFGWVPPTAIFNLLGGFVKIKSMIEERKYLQKRLSGFDLTLLDINTNKTEEKYDKYFGRNY